MKTKSRIAPAVPQVESPVRHLPLVDLLVDTRTELLELALRSGLKVFTTMLEEDRTAICGPRYAHEPDRPASRAGTTRSEVVIGGRKVAIQRPRVRTAAGEVALPTFEAMAATDPLEAACRRADARGRGHTPIRTQLGAARPRDGEPRHQQERRRFVARTTAQLAAWQSAPLDGLDLVALLIDGVHLGDHCLIVAPGIAADGQKHALGLWDGSTENATVCQGLLAHLQSRGLRTDRSVLVILDGSKALRKAVRATLGEAGLVQRCQVHKMRNILEYLNDRQRPWAQAILRRAYQSADVTTAHRLLLDLARRLETEHPSAAESVREGLDETLTVLTLNLSARLRRSLATTNAAESLLSRTRHVKRNVKRWRSGQMMLRWVAAGVLEAVKGFRRVKGYADMPMLVAALRARDRQLGLSVAQEERQIA
jgi:hypothetical protein